MGIFAATRNALKDGRGVTMVPPALGAYPPSNLHDDTEKPAIFGSTAANPLYQSNLTMWDNGGLDSWLAGVPIGGWLTSGPSTCQQDSTNADGAGSCARLTAGGWVKHLVDVVPGLTHIAKFRVKNSTSACAGQLFIRNQDTGRFVALGGASWGAAAYAATSNATAYASVSLECTAELLAAVLDVGTTLEVYVQTTATAGQFTYVDKFEFHPKWDFVSLHGVRIDPRMGVKVQGSDDGATWVDVTGGAITLRAPSCYVRFETKQSYQWFRLLLTGTPSTAPALDELVVANAVKVARERNGTEITSGVIQSFRLTQQRKQTRLALRSGAQRVGNIGRWPLRTLEVGLKHLSLESYKRHRDQLCWASQDGAEPIVIVTPEEDEDVCIRGRLEADLATDHPTQGDNDFRSTTLRIVEEPYSTITS